MVCEKCGKDNLEGRETCQECGAKLEAKGVLSYVPGGSNVATVTASNGKHIGLLVASVALFVFLIAEIYISRNFLEELYDSDVSFSKTLLLFLGYFFFWMFYVAVKGFTQNNIGSVKVVAYNLAGIGIVALSFMGDVLNSNEYYIFIGSYIEPILLIYIGQCAALKNQECGAKIGIEDVSDGSKTKHVGMLIAGLIYFVILLVKLYNSKDFFEFLLLGDRRRAPKVQIFYLLAYMYFWCFCVVIGGINQNNLKSLKKVAFNVAGVIIMDNYMMSNPKAEHGFLWFLDTFVQPVIVLYIGKCAASAAKKNN